jgi:Ner family transcriptional regulator
MSAAKKLTNRKMDVHPADVVAALKKCGSSLAALAKEHGYARRSFSSVWVKAWPQVQDILAAKLGTTPQELWPTRYNRDGSPKPKCIVVRIADLDRGRNA